MKSVIYQDLTPFVEPTECKALPTCRAEVPVSIRSNGRIYRFVLRDRLVPEDAYLVMVKAALFSLAQGEPYNGKSPERSVKDFLIKDQVVI